MPASTRRRFLRAAGSSLASLGLIGCTPDSEAEAAERLSALRRRLGLAPPPAIGGYVGQSVERGHRLRSAAGDHLYTHSSAERDYAVSIGYSLVGTLGYVFLEP